MRKSHSMMASTLAIAVVAALACTQAMASGFQIREDSIQAMSRSMAGSGSDWGDAAVVANNPAAMSLFGQTTVQTDLTLIDLSGHFTGGGVDVLGRPLTGGNGGDLGDTAPVPAFHAIIPFGNGFTLGASVTAPFGLKTEYNDINWVGRYQALKSDVKTVDITVAGAYKFNDMFSVGASVIYQRLDAELTNAVDFGAIALKGGCPVCQTQVDGTARIKGNDSNWGWDIGVLFSPSKDTNIGLNYRSKINHSIDGKASFTKGLYSPLFPAGIFDPETTAMTSVATPSVVTLSASQKLSDTFTLSASVERTNWSSLKNLVVVFGDNTPTSTETFNWKDTTAFAIGMDWQFDPHWVLRAGYGHDQTPTNNTWRDPRLPDGNRNQYSIGLGWMPNDKVTFNAGYSYVSITKTSVNDLAVTRSTLVGNYNGDANLFGVSATFAF
ncbi:MAG: outer membrane protein transport protein [Proteobacteria bacterium]|nr:outer membrane protein transport protein [Pseudomonadota bacterium]